MCLHRLGRHRLRAMEGQRQRQAGDRRQGLECGSRLRILGLFIVLSMWVAPSVCQINSQSDPGTYAAEANTIGINFGRVADNLPAPAQAVELIKNLSIGRVKIFDTDASVLTALANSGLEVVVGLANDGIAQIAASAAAGDQWVEQNVATYYPATNIVSIIVGNEIFSDTSLQSTWTQLVPAIENIHQGLQNRNLSAAIKVSTAVALDVLSTSYPPSAGIFRADIADSVLQPLLQYLNGTHSYLFVNAYPYFAWSSSSSQISLSYALFGSSTATVVDGNLQYTNLLDAQLDAVSAAMAKLGYGNVRLAISETGWPTLGDANEVGANIDNAANFNRRLVRKILSTMTTMGTPLKPGVFIPTFIFALFNEDLKTGATTERNWGILYPNGSQVYPIDMTGKLADGQYSPSANTPVVVGTAPPPATLSGNQTGSTAAGPTSPATTVSVVNGTWCVANAAADNDSILVALNYACGAGAANCVPIQSGQSCYQPNTVASHASYAFNSYWQLHKTIGASCNFGGTATLTQQDPSYGTCIYPN